MGKKRAGAPRRSGSGSVDPQRLARALSYPGIDPRVWVSQAIVISPTPVIEPTEGVFVDVLLLPAMLPATARLAALYAGPSFGLYSPVEENDEVTVFAPSGDPDEGLILLPRAWSPSDPPPAEASRAPQDVLLVMKENQNVRLITKGTGKVILGDEGANKAVARVDDETSNGALSITAVPFTTPAPGILFTFTYTRGDVVQVIPIPVVGALTGGGSGSITLGGSITEGADKVRA